MLTPRGRQDKLLVARQQVAGGGVRPGRGLAARQEPVRRLDSRPSSKTRSAWPDNAVLPGGEMSHLSNQVFETTCMATRCYHLCRNRPTFALDSHLY